MVRAFIVIVFVGIIFGYNQYSVTAEYCKASYTTVSTTCEGIVRLTELNAREHFVKMELN